jgi:hypothetical protein
MLRLTILLAVSACLALAGRADEVRILIAHEADAHALDIRGFDAAHYAALRHPEILNLLVATAPQETLSKEDAEEALDP